MKSQSKAKNVTNTAIVSENLASLRVDYKKASDLKPFEKNARTHSEEQVAQIVASINEWGWTNPILIDEDNGIIADPFAGSGSTLIACEIENRDCVAVEIDPQYCDVVVRRWQDFTGEKATLESTGEEFPG